MPGPGPFTICYLLFAISITSPAERSLGKLGLNIQPFARVAPPPPELIAARTFALSDCCRCARLIRKKCETTAKLRKVYLDPANISPRDAFDSMYVPRAMN